MAHHLVCQYINLSKNKSDENIVKIISSGNRVIYFTRSNSPYFFKSKKTFLKKHLSIISFKRKSLIKFSNYKRSELEKIESIELMRAIENYQVVGTFRLQGDSFSVDVKKNYLLAKKLMTKDEFFKKYK